MTTFSASDAALEGFNVIRRHWRVVVGWAGFNLLAVVAMIVLTVVVAVPLALASQAGSDSASHLGAAIGGVVWGVGYLAVQIVLTSGLYRLLLRPEEPAFLHLRLGASELRVLAATVLFILVLIAGLVLGRLVVSAAPSGHPGLAIALTAALVVAGWLLTLRLSLAPVLSFAERRVRFLEAWRRTRGMTWALAGMSLLMICLFMLITVVIWIALFVLGGLLTGFHDLGLTGAESLAAHPGRYILQIVAEMMLAPFFLVILQAPWVAVYRAITRTAAGEPLEAA
jgi:hypothetical protein